MRLIVAILLAQLTVQQNGVMKGQATGVDCRGLNATCTVQGGKWLLFVDAGTSGGGSGAPTNAQYWTGAADGTLSAEKNLGALGTGLVVNTAGTPSTYAGSTCPASQYATATSASGALTCSAVANAATATALAANPTDCAPGQYAHTIAANGNLTCSTPTNYVRFSTWTTVFGDVVAATDAGVGTWAIEFSGIPAKSRITRFVADTTTGWDDGAGPMVTSNLSCGTTAGGGDFLSSHSIFTPNVRGDQNSEQSANVGQIYNWSADTRVWCQWSCSGAFLKALTSGQTNFYIEYIQYP